MPPAITSALRTRDFTGARRAVTRVTLQVVELGTYPVGDQVYSSIVFPTVAQPAFELPNLRSVSWQRSADSEVATATLTLFNTAPLPPGSEPPVDDTFDDLGFYSPKRGRTLSSPTWGHRANIWQDHLVPDRVVRIYQGYGADYSVPPESDPHLVLMGCFVIDDVTYSADGTIEVEARDYARLLMDQVAFPPVVPLPHYPLHFESFHQVKNPDVVVTTGSNGWVGLAYDFDSGVPYNGRNGDERGHHGTDAFDGSDSSFWMSIGNARANAGYSFEYVQGRVTGKISAARAHVWGGPYTVYLSVRVGEVWQGAQKVPYDPHNPVSAPNGSDVPFLRSGRVERDGTIEFTFDELDNVTAVRFGFGDLYNSGIGRYPYRAGVRSMQVIRNSLATTTRDGGYRTEGNFKDFTDIVKRLLAYGGFYWPPGAKQVLTAQDFSHPHVVPLAYAGGDDPILGRGRVYGDLEMSGAPTFSAADSPNFAQFGIEIFNLKPLLDCINAIKDILGFLFFVDENGGAVFRLPNIFQAGSIAIAADGSGGHRTRDVITITDSEVILSLRSKLSSRNARERFVVANVGGGLAATADGRVQVPVRFRRIGVYSDQHFERQADVNVMADMIALRGLYLYRQNTVRIPADPRIQVDDQVRIAERVTGEDYLHYVQAISCQWDIGSGKWTYDLTTAWLGTDPTADWAFATSGLSQETVAFLAAVNQL